MRKPAGTHVCFLTTGQPSNNPRLVKEADALTEAGYSVYLLCIDCGLWPSQMDSSVMADRRWQCQYVGGMVQTRPLIHRAARLRQACGKRLLPWFSESDILRRAAMARFGPELEAAALRHPAALYIAHHVAVLPAAAKAAAKFGGLLGYDAEDFYSGMHPIGHPPGMFDRIAGEIERKYLKLCDYVTASAPGIADAYVARYGIARPLPVLNLFPLAQRPSAFRSGTPGPLRLYWFSQCIGRDRGIEDIVQAMGLLSNANIELHLRGNWQSGYQERLFAVARAAGTNIDRIVSHDPAPPDEMVRLSAEYDVGLALEQPLDYNRTICLSNKLFVYLLAGNAIAATSVPGQQSLVTGLGEAAYTYRPGDIQSLATGIHKWYADRQALQDSRRQAWEWGGRRFNWDAEKRTFLSIVESIAAPADRAVSLSLV
jgi:glycosyltransferase involved in cell wall biosynthesis